MHDDSSSNTTYSERFRDDDSSSNTTHSQRLRELGPSHASVGSINDMTAC